MNDGLKFHLNLSPWRLFDVLKDERDFGLFENLEALEGQTKCDYSIVNASTLKQMIKNEKELEDNVSMLDEFLFHVQPLDFRMALLQTLNKHDLL